MRAILFTISLLCASTAFADNTIIAATPSSDGVGIKAPVNNISIDAPFDRISIDAPVTTLGSDTIIKKKSFLKQWWEGIAHGNVDHTFDRPVDFTFALAPYYSRESSVGLGGQLSALFRINRTDSLLQPCDFSLLGGASVTGTYSVGFQGNINWSRKHRMNYFCEFKHQVRDFWGINYMDCCNLPPVNNNCTRITAKADYQQNISGNWFWGGALRVTYMKSHIDSLANVYLRDQPISGTFFGIGALVQYDSRDFILNPKRGLYFLLREIYYPKFLGDNEHNVYTTTLQFNAYHRLWKDATLAYDVFTEFNSSNGVVPWQLREEICYDDRRLRGYYAGSFIDNNQMCAQVELRQHIWKRLGAAAWIGAGTLFTTFNEIGYNHILPTYGMGLRFEIKHNTNLRFDIAGGYESMSLIFNFAEAF